MAASTAFKGLGRIDTHHHCFPDGVPELASEWKSVSQSEKGADIGLAAMRFPTCLQDHLEYMDHVGIQTAVMTPSIKGEWHINWSPKEWKDLCHRTLQAQLAQVATNPLRLGCFAMIPLPHVAESVEFIQEVWSGNGLRPDGFAVSTSMGNKYLGDPSFEEVWKALDAVQATLFVHPTDTVMPPNLQWGPFVMEYPFDTCRCISNVIVSGVLTRYPNIRFLFSHNGGAFPFLAGRIGKQHVDTTIMRNNNGKTLLQVLQTSNIFFDTAVSAPFQYRLMVEDLGIPRDHIVYATDYPYTFRPDTKSYLDGYEAPRSSGVFSTEELDSGLVRENALRHLFPRLAGEFEKLREKGGN